MSVVPANEPVTILLRPSDRAELDELARAGAGDVSAIVTEAVAAYLERQRRHAALVRLRLSEGPDSTATEEEVEAAYALFR